MKLATEVQLELKVVLEGARSSSHHCCSIILLESQDSQILALQCVREF